MDQRDVSEFNNGEEEGIDEKDEKDDTEDEEEEDLFSTTPTKVGSLDRCRVTPVKMGAPPSRHSTLSSLLSSSSSLAAAASSSPLSSSLSLSSKPIKI